MTTSAVRQPQGIPAGGQFATTAHAEPRFTLRPLAIANVAALAAAETPILTRRRAFLQDQILMVESQQRALACAAAAHHVLERHPDAAVLVFSVRDDRPHLLANVLDGAGRILPARRTGDWAEAVLAEVRQEPAGALTAIDGVEAAGTSLRVTISTVVAGVTDMVSTDEPDQPRHPTAARSVA